MSHELGPLAGLEGIWEGEKGTDTAPDDDPANQEINKYRERMTFEPTGLVANHTQKLYGLRYTTTAWRLGEDEPFHEELGYWLWDADTIHYREDTVLKIPGQHEPFHHTDENTLTPVR